MSNATSVATDTAYYATSVAVFAATRAAIDATRIITYSNAIRDVTRTATSAAARDVAAFAVGDARKEEQ